MQARPLPPRSVLCVRIARLCLAVSLGGASFEAACTPVPVNDALGWNGRGATLPVESGAAGASQGGQGGAPTGAAGAGAATGEAGTSGAAGSGAAGAGDAPGTGVGGGGGAPTGAAGASAGTGGHGGGSGSGPPPVDAGLPPPVDGGPPVGATCHLAVTVTTHSGGGSHSPKNVDAIWIEDAGGTFVKSLYVMARNEIQHLNAWNASTSSRNRVDAVTGATLPNYGTRMATWNCTDVNQKLVAQGAYQVCFDLNDGNGSDKHTCDALTFGKTAVMLMPPDALPSFTGRVLTYTP